jgi:cell division septation protein DedD
MADGTYNRPQRLFEPRGAESRGPDLRGADQGAIERRGPTSDPLLELARLIGQSDPFAPVRGRAGDAPHGGFDSQDRGPVERAPAERAPFIRPPSRDFAPSQDQPYRDRPFPDRPAFLDPLPQDRSFEEHASQDHAPHARYEPDFGRHDAQPAPPPRFPLQPDPASAPQFGRAPSFSARPADRDAFPVAPQQAPAEDYAGDAHYADPQAAYDAAHGQQGEYAGDYDDTEYEQEAEYVYEAEPEEAHHGDGVSSPKRRNTTKVVIAVLGLAVFGSAAAFGYRTVFKGAPTGPAPVIRADTSPTKVMPAASDPNQKAIGERLAGGPGERVEPREEAPVDLSRATAGGVMGGGPYQGPPGFSSSAAPSSGSGSLTDPKKVRTVTIRADQGQPAPPAAPPTRSAAQRQAAAPPSAPGAATPDAPSARAAAVPPAAAPRAADSAAGGGGGYVVQLMAAKSEADAQAAFRSAQAKYSALNGRQPLIRRKDTANGVFYAAQVGPFGAKGDAEQLCDTLKSSGGNCWVYKN